MATHSCPSVLPVANASACLATHFCPHVLHVLPYCWRSYQLSHSHLPSRSTLSLTFLPAQSLTSSLLFYPVANVHTHLTTHFCTSCSTLCLNANAYLPNLQRVFQNISMTKLAMMLSSKIFQNLIPSNERHIDIRLVYIHRLYSTQDNYSCWYCLCVFSLD